MKHAFHLLPFTKAAVLATALLLALELPLSAARPISKEALTGAMQRGGMTNADLAGLVRSTGVSFALAPADEQALKSLGAGPDLIEAVRASRVNGRVQSAGKPLAPIELMLKLFHATPAAAAAALRTRGAGFNLTPAIETQILEAGGDKALLTLAVLRRLEVEKVAAVTTGSEEPPAAAGVRAPAPQTAGAEPQPAPAAGPRPIRVDAAAQAKKLVRKLDAEFPQIAFRARMSGTVVLEALVGKDGRVRRTRVLRGDSIFHEAAIAAAQSYVYKPTMLDDTPTDVITEIAVEFDLAKAELGMKN